MSDVLARLDAAQAKLDAERAERAAVYAENERERLRRRTEERRGRGDPRSRVNGGPGRAGRKQGARAAGPRPSGRKRAPVGRLEPLEPGRGDQRIVLVYGAQAKAHGAITSDGEHHEVEGKAAVRKWWERAAGEGWAVYSLVPLDLVLAADSWRAGWRQYKRNGRAGRIVSPEGATCWSLSRFFRGRRDAEVAREALTFFDAVNVPPRSLVSMARSFLRTTLPEPVTTFGLPWSERQLHRELAYPARQGGWSGTYRGHAYDDISAAYPHALGGAPFPQYLTLSDRRPGACPLAVEATVEVPEQPWGPLPVWQRSGRVAGERAVCYGWGEVRGWWSWRELELAMDAGARVVAMHRFLRGEGPTVSFTPWLDQAMQLRGSLPPAARVIAKACTSMTWAVFGLTDARDKVTTWQGARTKRDVHESTTELPGLATAYVANEVHARVRERLYREGLAPGGAIYADTDGVIRPAHLPPAPGWSRRYDMAVVSVAGPQWYRWAPVADGPVSWCTSGIPEGAADPAKLAEIWDQAQPPDGTPLVGSLPWSGELMQPGDVSGAPEVEGETQRPGDWRSECWGCGEVLTPATAYPLNERTYCVSCLQVEGSPLWDHMPPMGEAF